MDYDYIVIGAGTAGCIVASRLTEDPGTSVLLIEAGGWDRSIIVRMPAAVPLAYQKASYGWGYQSGPEPFVDNKMLDEKRGRLIGGSSSINAMIFNRGNPMDFEGWAAQGLAEWDYAHVLPYFRKMESFSGGADDWRGGDGPMKVDRCKADHRMFETWLTAGEQAGYPTTPDHNGFQQEGLHRAQTLIGDGERWTTAQGYLRAAQGRSNLTIWTRALVHKVLVEGDRAVGVELTHKGQVRKVTAGKEVILSAGSFNTPKLMMLSGIGPADHLRAHGIAVKHDVPDVGENLENHVAASVQYLAADKDSLAGEFTMMKRAMLGVDWILRRKGMGAISFYQTGGFIRTRPDVPWPNIQYEFLPFMRGVVNGRLKATPGFMIYFQGCRPQNTGRVTLTSADPAAPPKMIFNHLQYQQDMDDLVDALKIAREMVAQPAWDGIRGREVKPGAEVTTKADLEAYIRSDLGTCYHPCGTAKMGVVTDDEGRVKAVRGLRVVDASIMPRVLTGNISAGVMMLAEKISDRIRGRAALAPSRAEFFHHPHARV
ncbi:choline dehydrogenase [Albidovulum sp.]|uniref:choline dehydrogenase n=1 Tax=Albidovulum sp. TaxID=1872424 RepID=UPI0039B99D1B